MIQKERFIVEIKDKEEIKQEDSNNSYIPFIGVVLVIIIVFYLKNKFK